MSRIHEGMEYKEFKMPSGIITAEVCKKSGMPAKQGVCEHDPRGSMLTTEFFAEGTVPEDECVHHAAIRVCASSGMLAGPYCPHGYYASGVRIIGGSPDSEDGPYLYTGNLTTCTVHTSAPAAEPDPAEGDAGTGDDPAADPNADADTGGGETPNADPNTAPGQDTGTAPDTASPDEGTGTVPEPPSEEGEDEPVPNEVLLDF